MNRINTLVSVVEELTHSNISEEVLDSTLTEIFSSVSEEEINEVADKFIQSSVVEMIPEHAEEINELFGLGKKKPYMKDQPSAMDKLKSAASKVLGHVKSGFEKAKNLVAPKKDKQLKLDFKQADKANAEKKNAHKFIKKDKIEGKQLKLDMKDPNSFKEKAKGALKAAGDKIYSTVYKPSHHDAALEILRSRYNKPLAGGNTETSAEKVEAPVEKTEEKVVKKPVRKPAARKTTTTKKTTTKKNNN